MGPWEWRALSNWFLFFLHHPSYWRQSWGKTGISSSTQRILKRFPTQALNMLHLQCIMIHGSLWEPSYTDSQIIFSWLPWWLRWLECTCNAGDLGSVPGLGRPPGEGNGNPLQYSCLENPRNRGAWQVTSMGSQCIMIYGSLWEPSYKDLQIIFSTIN